MATTKAGVCTVLPLADLDGYSIPFGASIEADLLLPPEPSAGSADHRESSGYNDAWDINKIQSFVTSGPGMTAKVSGRQKEPCKAVPCNGGPQLLSVNANPGFRKYVPLQFVPETGRPRGQKVPILPPNRPLHSVLDSSIALRDQQ